MELPLIAVIAALAALAAALVALFRRREDGGARSAEQAATAQAELAGRLTQLAESQTTALAEMADLLRKQEHAVANTVGTGLDKLGKQMSESLKSSGETQQTVLSKLGERLATIDAAQKSLTELSTQVVGLQDILSNNQARGAFGEFLMEDIVAKALPPNAYAMQATLGNGRRADCLLRLPNPPGPIVIDAKFPLASYQAMQDAPSGPERERERSRFAGDVLRHVRDIAERYILAGETAESALMFLPSEAVYAELHANLREVVEQSYRARVWIVSPTTLMAVLNTVRAVLKDVQMREQAHVIQREVRMLLEDAGRLDKRVGNLERHFGQVEKDLREIRISSNRIAQRGERIEAIEVGDDPAAATLLPEAGPPASRGG